MALGIGILMGISMVDSTLVFNQIAVIEELEGRIHNYRQDNEEIVFQRNKLQDELERWDILKERYLKPFFKDTLHDLSITIIAGDDYPAELLEFLEVSGCSYRAYYLVAPEQWNFDPKVSAFSSEAFEEENIRAFSYGEILWEGISRQDNNEGDKLLVILQEQGLLEVKSYSAKDSFALYSEAIDVRDDIFLLTGDISFVISVLKQGMPQSEDNYTWIAIDTGIENEVSKTLQLPGNWTMINDGGNFFSKVELWESLKSVKP